jgi:hypothetical protein
MYVTLLQQNQTILIFLGNLCQRMESKTFEKRDRPTGLLALKKV